LRRTRIFNNAIGGSKSFSARTNNNRSRNKKEQTKMIAPDKNENGELFTRRTQIRNLQRDNIIEHEFRQEQSSLPQWFARGNVRELKQINAAVDALNNSDIVVVRSAFAVLAEFERRDQFRMEPSESELFVLLMKAGFPDRLVVAAMKRFRRDRKFSFITAMSWQALKWAFEQRGQDLSASAVLFVRANHADKNGRGWLSDGEIAEHIGASPATVRRADERLIEKGLMQFTGERAGQTLSVKVYQLLLPRSSLTTSELKDGKLTRSSLEAHSKLTRSDTASRYARARNLEPGTSDKGVSSPQNSHLSSNEERKITRPTTDSRPRGNRPKDKDEMESYFNGDEPEAECLHYLDESDLLWFWEANQANDWKTGGKFIHDWKAWARSTYHAQKFPTQRQKKGRE
jgi:hypothetical protein